MSDEPLRREVDLGCAMLVAVALSLTLVLIFGR